VEFPIFINKGFPMQKPIEILDHAIKTKRPDFHSRLNRGLTDFEIAKLEDKFHFILPYDLKELYKWKNGQSENCFDTFISNSMFMPLENVFESKHCSDAMIGSDFEIENWWNENWFPIFHDGGGNHICYDDEGTFTEGRGQILEFWHADNDRNVIFPNLLSFLESIAKFYAITEAEDFDGHQEYCIQSPEGFPKRFIVE